MSGSFLQRDASINITDVGGGMWKDRVGSQMSFFLSFFKGIGDYITGCKQAIGKFESLVHQIHKNADDISSRLTLIEAINLFKYPAAKSEEELPGRSDFWVLQLWN